MKLVVYFQGTERQIKGATESDIKMNLVNFLQKNEVKDAAVLTNYRSNGSNEYLSYYWSKELDAYAIFDDESGETLWADDDLNKTILRFSSLAITSGEILK